MEGIRRTVPRSMKRIPKREAQVKQRPLASERYVPDFQTKEPLTLLEHKPIAVQHSDIKPHMIQASEPLSCVRWMPVQEREAFAVVGSSDGEDDQVSVYAVSMASGEMKSRLARRIVHHGIVRTLNVSETNDAVFVGSLNGQVHRLKVADWENSKLELLLDVSVIRNREEGVTGVAAISGQVVAAGEHGSLCGIDIGTGAVWGRQFDEVGFSDVMTVNENGNELTTAGCQVCVWDLRTGNREVMVHQSKGVAMCVTGDPGMPQFILAGMRDGEVAIWDRRSERTPINRVAMHQGPVWDVCMASGRSGVLLSGGEDGSVFMADFAHSAMKAGLGSKESVWGERGEYWRVAVDAGDLNELASGPMAVNSVAVHSGTDLFAYASDGGELAFGRLDTSSSHAHTN